MKYALFVLVLATAVATATAEVKPPSSFYDFLQGDWEVLNTKVDMKTGEQTYAELRGHYLFEKENGTLNLIGHSFDNDTSSGELLNEMEIGVEFATPNSGSFKTGASDFDLKSLFEFDFAAQENGVALSHGEWHGAKPSWYQFTMSGVDRFQITVFPKDGTPNIQVLVGRKIPVNAEKTFFQQWGTMIMIGGMFLVNGFLQRRMRPAATPAAPAAAAAASGTRTRTAGGAIVEKSAKGDAAAKKSS